MSVATLGNIPFELDPESIAYNFAIKSAEINTVGGKVVQIFGTRLSDIMVSGSFGSGGTAGSGWQAQQAFLDSVTAQMKSQVGPLVTNGSATQMGYHNGPPIRFTFAPRGIDAMVYILDFMQTGSTSSILFDNQIINPGWTLQLFIVSDNGALAASANQGLLSFLNRIAEGIGWHPNTFNGPNADAGAIATDPAGNPTASPAATTNPATTNTNQGFFNFNGNNLFPAPKGGPFSAGSQGL